jgi:hypothetical protein
LPRTVQVLTAHQALSFLIVGAFWGCTNPLLKRASHGINEVKGGWLAVRARVRACAREAEESVGARTWIAGGGRERRARWPRAHTHPRARNVPGAGAEVCWKPAAVGGLLLAL